MYKGRRHSRPRGRVPSWRSSCPRTLVMENRPVGSDDESCRQGAPRTCGTGHRNCALLGFWQRLQALSSLVLGLRWTSAKTSSTMSSRPWCVDFPLLLLRSASYDNPTSIHVARSQSQTHCSFGNDALHPKETTACREPASHTACRFFTRSPGTHPGSSFRVYRNA